MHRILYFVHTNILHILFLAKLLFPVKFISCKSKIYFLQNFYFLHILFLAKVKFISCKTFSSCMFYFMQNFCFLQLLFLAISHISCKKKCFVHLRHFRQKIFPGRISHLASRTSGRSHLVPPLVNQCESRESVNHPRARITMNYTKHDKCESCSRNWYTTIIYTRATLWYTSNIGNPFRTLIGGSHAFTNLESLLAQ